jgi:hypothetical protein
VIHPPRLSVGGSTSPSHKASLEFSLSCAI